MNLELLNQAQYLGGAGYWFIRGQIKLKEPVKQAIISIVADVHSYARDNWMSDGSEKAISKTQLLGGSFLKYRLFVNGQAVGAGPLRPVDNDIPVLHNYDITQYLQASDNCIGIINRGEKNGVKFVITLKYMDNSAVTVFSNREWKVWHGQGVYPSVAWERQNIEQYFKGHAGPGEWAEHLDGRLYPYHWNEVGFDDSFWSEPPENNTVTSAIETRDNFNYTLCTVLPQRIIRLNNQIHVIDFGREVVGGIRLASAEKGAVEVRLGEELLSNGQVRFQMRTDNCYQELWRLAGDNLALEHFGLRAFRYAEIVDYPGNLTEKQIQAIAVNAEFKDEQSSFECSNPKLSTVWRLCKNTIKMTSLDVYTDCPSRERIAYESDSYIAMLTHFAVEYNPVLARRTLRYQINHLTWPMEWRYCVVPAFYDYLMYTGDYALLRNYYPLLKEFVPSGTLQKDFDQTVIVDWPESQRDGYQFGAYNTVANEFAIWSLEKISKIARLLGFTQEAIEYQIQHENYKKAFNQILLDKDKGLYLDNIDSVHHSFHANMFALAFDLVPENYRENCLNYIEKRGMSCSVYAAFFYLDALFRNGRCMAAFNLIISESKTSWLNMIKQGAVATMEAWSPDDKKNVSFAHPWGSAPGYMISKYILGLSPITPGWQEFTFTPAELPLEFSAKLPTPAGTITVKRHQDDGKFINSIKFPPSLKIKEPTHELPRTSALCLESCKS